MEEFSFTSDIAFACNERIAAWYARMARVAQAKQARPPKRVKRKGNKWTKR